MDESKHGGRTYPEFAKIFDLVKGTEPSLMPE